MHWLVRSAIGSAFLLQLASCSVSHETRFTPEGDEKTIANLGGLWVSVESADRFTDASLDPFDAGALGK